MRQRRPGQCLLKAAAWLPPCLLAAAAALPAIPVPIKIVFLIVAAVALLAVLTRARPTACLALRRAGPRGPLVMRLRGRRRAFCAGRTGRWLTGVLAARSSAAQPRDAEPGDEGLTGGPAPIHAALALDGDFSCIAQARDLVADFLLGVRAEHGLPVSARTVDVARLVVSELVTNARKYAPGPALLELRVADAEVHVTVWDSDPALPVARAAEAGRVGQHGLEIVMSLAQSFQAHREPVGKRITASIALADNPRSEGAAARSRRSQA